MKEFKYYIYDTGAVRGDPGAKLENAVACALLRELRFLEDTTGSRVALHYLRDKEKNEVDFLPVVDDVPICMIEVKAGDDTFSRALFHFGKTLDGIPMHQVVYGLTRRKTRGSATMLPAHEFLSDLDWLNNP